MPWLIPVRFDDCEIPDWDIGAGRTIGSIQRADLFGDGYDAEADRLVVAVRRILGRPSGKPRPSPWPERKVDAEDIESLNPREAARRLALARPDDAVRALRGASASASGDALAILFKDNEALAVALLAMARRDKARELIGAILSAPGWLDGRRTGGGRSASKMERLAIALTRAAGSEPGDDSSYRGAQEQLSQMPARTAADVLNRLSAADASAALWSLRAYDARWCADVLEAMADERASEILRSATFRDRYRLPRTARIQQLLVINAPAQRRSTPKRPPG